MGNTLLLGHPDETISSRLGRTVGRERYFWVAPFRNLVDLIFFFDKEVRYDEKKEKIRLYKHCELSIIPLEQMSFRDYQYEVWTWCSNKSSDYLSDIKNSKVIK